MIIKVGLITRFDSSPLEDFPHIMGAWSDDGPIERTYYDDSVSSERHVFTGTKQIRTVTTEGLLPPTLRELNRVEPPRYPPVMFVTAHCDSALLATIQANNAYMILSADDIGNGVPPAAEDRGMDDPMPDEVFTDLSTKIVALTRNVIGEDEADHIDTALANWRGNNPEGTPREFYLAVNRFTS